jgi:small-conductance mechanosensitive channel
MLEALVVSLTVSTQVSNALFFGAALAILFLTSFVLSRQTGRVLEVGLYAANRSDRAALQSLIRRKTSRVIALLTAVISLGLVAAGVVFTLHGIAVAPRVWAWAEATFLQDPTAVAWLLGELLALLLAAIYLRGALRALVGLGLDRLRRDPAFARFDEPIGRLQARVDALLRWGMVLAAIAAAGVLLTMPTAFNDPLIAVTYIVLGVLGARMLVVVASLAVDIAVQVVRTLEDRPGPLRYVGRLGRLGRLEHLAGITKRTLEYFIVVGAATLVVHNLRPGTWLSELGLLAIRLIALVYVGRVVIEVFSLILREVLLADPDKHSEGELQQRMTLVPVASSILRYAVYFCITVMALQELGVDSSPILAGAGLLGLAVGLGAQTLVGDVVSGFFILFEGLFLVGDRIRVGEVLGSVEEIGIRVLKIRDEFGVLHCIPNGEVRAVANHARLFVNAVVEFSLPYDEDIHAVLDQLRARLDQVRGAQPDIVAEPELVVQELMDTGVLIRCVARCKPSRDDSVGDVVRTEIFAALVAAGVTPRACHVVKLHEGARARDLLAAPRTASP